ncbi:glycosyl hydrolase family 61-domain-containing protein [Cladochytrium replicatum]|nr:glycosyl hydrolase family 61-domain-containing protein [Cladochytrium replicatum]
MAKALAVFFLVAISFANYVAGHFYVDSLNGSGSPLRPIASYIGGENSPVSGDKIEREEVVCNAARPFNAFASRLTVAAGDTVTMHWTITEGSREPIGSAHYGPCHVYIGQGLKPGGWTKIFETTPDNSNDWCTNIIAKNNNNYRVKIPSFLAPGDYVLRVQLVALHVAEASGGAEFYVRCMDIRVTGSGAEKPPFEVKIPGAWNRNTPGVLFNLYTVSNPGNGAQYKGKYPSWGGKLWTGGAGLIGTITRTTTTTTSKAPSAAATTTTTRTTTTTIIIVSSTTKAATSPSPTRCAAN